MKRQICLKLQPKPRKKEINLKKDIKIKAISSSWAGCEQGLRRGNPPTRLTGDLGSISSLTPLLAAESWIIKNPPEHGNVQHWHRQWIQSAQQNNTQGKEKKGQKEKLMLTAQSSHLPLVQLCKLSEAMQHLSAAFFLSEKTCTVKHRR